MSGNQRVNNMPSFGLRKVAFHRAKDGLLEGKRPSFTNRLCPSHDSCGIFMLLQEMPKAHFMRLTAPAKGLLNGGIPAGTASGSVCSDFSAAFISFFDAYLTPVT